MHKGIALKTILNFTLKQLLHVSVQSPSSGSELYELAKVTVTLASSNNGLPDDGDCTETCSSCFSVNISIVFKTIKHFNNIKMHGTIVKKNFHVNSCLFFVKKCQYVLHD